MKSITYSAIRTFLNCRKLFYYRYVRKLKPIEKAIYLDVGSCIHEFLAAHYRGDGETQNLIEEYFISRLPGKEDELYEEKETEAASNIETCKRIILRYINQYKQADEKLTFLAIENEFHVTAEDIGLNIDTEIIIKVDAIISNGGIRYLMEHKTAAGIDNNYKKKLTSDLQSMFYIMCLNALGYNVQGVCYNVISKKLPAKPELMKNGKLSTAKNRKPDLTEYVKAIEDNNLDPAEYEEYLEWLRCNQPDSFFREYIVYHENQLESLRDDLGSIIFDMLKSETEGENPESNYFYKNTSNCIEFGTCPFFDACIAPYPESIIENFFISKTSAHEELTSPPGA